MNKNLPPKKGLEIADADMTREKIDLTLNTTQSDVEVKEVDTIGDMLMELEKAFGGLRNIPESVVGMAIVSQIAMGNFGRISDVEEFTARINVELNRAVELIATRTSPMFKESTPDKARTRNRIIQGMKERTKQFPKNSRIVDVINHLDRMN